jgi:DNA-binding CsgD family transcriptional regulator
METLSASRLGQLLQAAGQIGEFRELSEFRVGAIALVRELVPCHSVSYNEVGPGTGAIVTTDPAGWLTPESLEIFASFASENPLIAHYLRSGDGQPVRFSNFVSQRRLHQLTLYDQLYRPMGIEHQIAFVLPSPPGEVVGIALNRERQDFTDEEAVTLDLLRVPLRASYRRLLEREELMNLLAAYDRRDDVAVRAAALGLSERQVEVMRGIIAGVSSAELAMSLGISRRTVEKHLQNIYEQLDVTSRVQAINKVQTRTDAATMNADVIA